MRQATTNRVSIGDLLYDLQELDGILRVSIAKYYVPYTLHTDQHRFTSVTHMACRILVDNRLQHLLCSRYHFHEQ